MGQDTIKIGMVVQYNAKGNLENVQENKSNQFENKLVVHLLRHYSQVKRIIDREIEYKHNRQRPRLY